MPEPQEEKSLTAEEEFEKAFEDAVSGKPFEEEEPEAVDTETEEGESSTEEVIPQTEDTEESKADAPSTSSDSSEAGDTDAAEETDWKALYEKEKQRTSSWEGRITAANKRAEEAEKRAKELEGSAGAQEETPPQKQEEADDADPELKEFFAEFPELEKPFTKLVEQRGAAIAQKIVQAEIEKIKPTLDTVSTNQQAEAERAHFAAIDAAHPDWRDSVQNGDLEKWIHEQPSIIRDRLTEVTQKGSASEVIELFDQFKKSSGSNPPQQSPQERSSKAAAAAAVPASSAGPPPDKDVEGDFDTEWEKLVSGK